MATTTSGIAPRKRRKSFKKLRRKRGPTHRFAVFDKTMGTEWVFPHKLLVAIVQEALDECPRVRPRPKYRKFGRRFGSRAASGKSRFGRRSRKRKRKNRMGTDAA